MITLIEDTIRVASKLCGISDIEFQVQPEAYFPAPEVNAMFNDEIYTIYFNSTWLETASEAQIMVAVFHEVRHAYQKMCVEFEQINHFESEERIKTWAKEFETYKDRTNYSKDYYVNQDIEIDAIAFASKVLKAYFDINVAIPEKVKEAVSLRSQQILLPKLK